MATIRLRFSRLVLALALVTLPAASAVAQLFPGRITGAVHDAQGALVAGANVKLQNTSTGLERSVDTDENGRIRAYLREWNQARHLEDFELSLSIGIAEWSDGKTLEEMLDVADRDMYTAKAASKAVGAV